MMDRLLMDRPTRLQGATMPLPTSSTSASCCCLATVVPQLLCACCRQNLVDSLAQRFRGPVPVEQHSELNTFVVYNERSRVTSSAKRRREPGSLKVHQTPDGSFLDLMRNAHDLLQRCGWDVPQVGTWAALLPTAQPLPCCRTHSPSRGLAVQVLPLIAGSSHPSCCSVQACLLLPTPGMLIRLSRRPAEHAVACRCRRSGSTSSQVPPSSSSFTRPWARCGTSSARRCRGAAWPRGQNWCLSAQRLPSQTCTWRGACSSRLTAWWGGRRLRCQ